LQKKKGSIKGMEKETGSPNQDTKALTQAINELTKSIRMLAYAVKEDVEDNVPEIDLSGKPVIF